MGSQELCPYVALGVKQGPGTKSRLLTIHTMFYVSFFSYNRFKSIVAGAFKMHKIDGGICPSLVNLISTFAL